MSLKRIHLLFLSALIGVGAYFLYAFIFVPSFLIPPISLQRNTPRHQAISGPSETIKRVSEFNARLLAPLFPDPSDWRRQKPGFLMTGDQSGLFLFEGNPLLTGNNRILSLASCTVVIPSQDRTLSIEERFRQAIVIETKDRLVLRFKGSLDLKSFSDSFFDLLEEGKMDGEVTIWSNMVLDGPEDDFRLTTRDVSFNAEQITTENEVVFHYANQQGEGTGLRVYIDLPPFDRSKREEDPSRGGGKNPFQEEFDEGNLFGGVSIKEVRLAKLSRLEFDMPDYLPTLSDLDPSFSLAGGEAPPFHPEESGEPEGGTEKGSDGEIDKMATMKLDVRCQGEVYFAPNLTDDLSSWGARFTGNVEITAFHDERDQDSLHCETLYFYLQDPVMKKKWEEVGPSYKGKRRPVGRLTRLIPYQLKAIGSEEKEARFVVANDFLTATGDEIVCDVLNKKLTLVGRSGGGDSPVTENAPGDGMMAVAASRPVKISYQGIDLTSDRVEFVYDPESYGSLIAYHRGTITGQYLDRNNVVSHLNVSWNDGVRINPVPDNAGFHVASFRGDVRFAWESFGDIQAEETDFWFRVLEKKESDGGGMGDVRRSPGGLEPQSLQFRQNVRMTTPRGLCQIRDTATIRFSKEIVADEKGTSPSPEEGNLFNGEGSLLGNEMKSTFLMTGSRLDVWAVYHPSEEMGGNGLGGNIDLTGITIQENIQFVENAVDTRKEILRIEGNDVRIENPNSPRVAITLLGQPASFNGMGLNLSGYDIRVNREKNTFSVIGHGRLRFTPRFGEEGLTGVGRMSANSNQPVTTEGGRLTARQAAADPSSLLGGTTEPIEVWWPGQMVFNGEALLFEGKEKESVLVRQGPSLELRAPLIKLLLRNRLDIFDFDMGNADSDTPREIALDRSVCQGRGGSPVQVSWFGTLPSKEGNGIGTKGFFKGEVTQLTLVNETGDLLADGPGWFRGIMETPPEMMNGSGSGMAGLGDGSVGGKARPWTHLHLTFNSQLTGNLTAQEVKARGDIRTVLGTFDRSDVVLDVEDRKTFPEDAFFLTCDELGLARPPAGQEVERFFEMTATGDTRFQFQTITGRGEALKYNDLKKTVTLQGNGVSQASLSRQERPGAEINTQFFNSVSFNLLTKKIDSNISGTSLNGNAL